MPRCIAADSEVGRTSAIILNPANNQVTHVVVKGKGDLMGEYLVPLAAIEKGAAHQLHLRWTQAEVAAADRFDQTLIVGGPGMEDTVIAPMSAADELTLGSPPPVSFIRVEQVPEAGLPLHAGAHVHATDGGVGQVDFFQVAPESGEVTHLVLRHGHLWGKRDITVPHAAIDHIADDVVYLTLDKAAVEELPSAPIQKD